MWGWSARSRTRMRGKTNSTGARGAAHGALEALQETRAVCARKRRRAAGLLAGAAQIGHQIARSQRHADAAFVEDLALRRHGLTAGGDTAGRERDIGGNDDAARHGTLGDPVVGLVEPLVHDDEGYLRITRHADAAIGNQKNLRNMARSHAVALVLHRAGIGVDEQGRAVRPAHAPGRSCVVKRPRDSMQSSVSGGLMKSSWRQSRAVKLPSAIAASSSRSSLSKLICASRGTSVLIWKGPDMPSGKS